MFRSARIQLTFFYLAILFGVSLIVTTSVRVLAEREYLHSNMVQRGEVREFVLLWPEWVKRKPDANSFIDVQEAQADRVRQRLNQELLLVNVSALMLGGVLSYWFAGRTLRPIEEAHEAQARFASDASHELRTPLTNLRLENEVFLRQKHFSEADARELINSNLEEVQRLEGLSTNLLSLTQYANTPLQLKTVPTKRLIHEAVKLAAKTARAKQVRLAKEYTPRNITGNYESLVQLLGILIDNAIKYGPEQGTVTVGGRVIDGQYELWVQDEGSGVSEADLPYIFDRLYRGDKARTTKAGGYGLGLSLAKAIAKANDVEIAVTNTKPGARFVVRIPLVKR